MNEKKKKTYKLSSNFPGAFLSFSPHEVAYSESKLIGPLQILPPLFPHPLPYYVHLQFSFTLSSLAY